MFNGGGDCRFSHICTGRFAIQLFCILSYVQAYSIDARLVLRTLACYYLSAVLRIRIQIRIWIHRIHMFLGLPDPDP